MHYEGFCATVSRPVLSFQKVFEKRQKGGEMRQARAGLSHLALLARFLPPHCAAAALTEREKGASREKESGTGDQEDT